MESRNIAATLRTTICDIYRVKKRAQDPWHYFLREQEYGSMFKNRQGKLTGQMNLKIETEKGNNVKHLNEILDSHNCHGRSKQMVILIG